MRDHHHRYDVYHNGVEQSFESPPLDINNLSSVLRIEEFEHRIKKPRSIEEQNNNNEEVDPSNQYPPVLKMWMKRTIFDNIGQISHMINRRPQCKPLPF